MDEPAAKRRSFSFASWPKVEAFVPRHRLLTYSRTRSARSWSLPARRASPSPRAPLPCLHDGSVSYRRTDTRDGKVWLRLRHNTRWIDMSLLETREIPGGAIPQRTARPRAGGVSNAPRTRLGSSAWKFKLTRYPAVLHLDRHRVTCPSSHRVTMRPPHTDHGHRSHPIQGRNRQ